jgi:23S rRNA pseudouridine1911/1915/1917 synthase
MSSSDGSQPVIQLDGDHPTGVWPKADPRVLFCDNHLLALVKPFNMPVAPDVSGDQNLLDWGRDWIKRVYHKPGNVWLGMLHRIDRPAAGLVLFARNSKAAARLTAQFKRHTVVKHYRALVYGRVEGDEGRLVDWLIKDEARNVSRRVTAAMPGAREARLSFNVIDRRCVSHASSEFWISELDIHLETGRPHQIRVQLAGLGHPLLGDLKYGATDPLPAGNIALFSRSIECSPPARSDRLLLTAPMPADGWAEWQSAP